MNIADIKDFACFLAEWLFNKEYALGVRVNNRLKSTLAWYSPSECIELNKCVTEQNIYVIADILSHELLHWHLDISNKPYDDSDMEFVIEAWRKGISETETTQFDDKGKILYQYSKHEYACDCGNRVSSYELSYRINNISDIKCCHCNKSMVKNYIGKEPKEYIPSFNIKMAVESYLNKNSKLIS
jgi:predicted SprT family Zn-dependent metalloprotease